MSFKFNGVNSDAMGLFVERYPERPFPSRKQTVYNIHGRSGDLIVDENAFTNVTQTYEVYIRGGSVGFQAKASAIAKWLLSPVGYAELTDSYDPTVYRKARFTGEVSFLNALNKYGKATITFDCCPQRYPVTPEILSGHMDDTFVFPTHPEMEKGLPIIRIPTFPVNSSGIIETDALRIVIPAQSATINSIIIDWESKTVSTSLFGVSIIGKWIPMGDGDEIRTVLETGTSVSMSVETRRWSL